MCKCAACECLAINATSDAAHQLEAQDSRLVGYAMWCQDRVRCGAVHTSKAKQRLHRGSLMGRAASYGQVLLRYIKLAD